MTKLSGKKHQQFRQAFRLSDINVYLFETPCKILSLILFIIYVD